MPAISAACSVRCIASRSKALPTLALPPLISGEPSKQHHGHRMLRQTLGQAFGSIF